MLKGFMMDSDKILYLSCCIALWCVFVLFGSWYTSHSLAAEEDEEKEIKKINKMERENKKLEFNVNYDRRKK
jgi:hypothetical protein